MKIQTTECAGNAEKPLSLWPTTNRVFFSGFGCTNGYATLQPHYRPSAKNTTNDCASWKAKSTTLNTWSGRKTTRSVTPTPTPCPTPWLPGKKKSVPWQNSSIHNTHACCSCVFSFKFRVKLDCTRTMMLNPSLTSASIHRARHKTFDCICTAKKISEK